MTTTRPLAASLLAAAMTLPFLATGLSAGELDLPSRKPGLWEIRITPETAGAAPSMSMQICLDPATDQQLMSNGLAMTEGKCSELDQSHDGNAIVIDATCDISGGVTRTHTTISGDFQSAYKIEIVSDREGGKSPLPKHSEVTQEATWTGACAADMQPGDMILLGRKINILNAMKTPGG